LAALAARHDRGDPFRRAVRNGAQRVVLQMGIALGSLGLTMPEHLADEVEAVVARYGDRGEAVPKVMNSDIGKPGRRPKALSGLLDADEMPVAAFGGLNRRDFGRADIIEL
jgi:hypothetical protein